MAGKKDVRVRGSVKWFSNAKGYGFIGREDGADVFVHYSDIDAKGYKALKEGDLVEFSIVLVDGSKVKAADVVRLEG
jgi:CspA family cold shock protein